MPESKDIIVVNAIDYSPEYLLENGEVVANEIAGKIKVAIANFSNLKSPRLLKELYYFTKLVNEFDNELELFSTSKVSPTTIASQTYSPKTIQTILRSSVSIDELKRLVSKETFKPTIRSAILVTNKVNEYEWQTHEEIRSKEPLYFIGKDKELNEIDKGCSLGSHSTNNHEGSVEIYTKKGWTKGELQAITSQDFITNMKKLPQPNTYLVHALLGLETDQSLRIVEDYLKSLRIDADWDDRSSDEKYSDNLFIASLFFDYFWDKRLPSFRDDNQKIEKNLHRLICLARDCDIKIGYQLLTKLADIGHDKVNELAKELAKRIDHKAYKFSATNYGEEALLRKREDILSQSEWDAKYSEPFTGGLLELLKWTVPD